MNTKLINLLPVFLSLSLLISCSRTSEPQQDLISSAVAVDDTYTDSGTEKEPELNGDSKFKISSDDINAVIASGDMVEYTPEDYYSDWVNQNPDYIELDGSSAAISGSGSKVEGNTITIMEAGIYVINGRLEDGQIIVNLDNGGLVQLVFNGADINCKENAPVYVKKADKAVISLENGKENTVSFGENTKQSSSGDKPNAAIYSNADLTITGAGTLTVNSSSKDGITSDGILKITDGNINIKALEDGLTGHDTLAAVGGNINIDAGGNGMLSTNDTDSSKGFIVLGGGIFTVTAGSDGMQATNTLLVTGGKYTISNNRSDFMKNSIIGGLPSRVDDTSPILNKSAGSDSNGLKAGSNLTINGGSFTVNSPDYALFSNHTLAINDGNLTLSSGDAGIAADTSVNITNGIINISSTNTGMKSPVITVLDGNIRITADQDGIDLGNTNNGDGDNTSEGTDTAEEAETSDRNNSAATPADNSTDSQNSVSSDDNTVNNTSVTPLNYLSINGGYLYVDAAGDGIDTNGSIFMTNGAVILNGSINNHKNTPDNNNLFEISGGLLIAAGSTAMDYNPSLNSTQCTVVYNFPRIQQAKQLIHLEYSAGDSLITFAPDKNYQTVVISLPDLRQNETYSIYGGGSASGTMADGLYTDGTYRDGTKLLNFKQSNMVTWLSQDSNK